MIDLVQLNKEFALKLEKAKNSEEKTQVFKEHILTLQANLTSEKEKEKKETFDYPINISWPEYAKLRIKNNDRITDIYYSKHFSSVKGSHTGISINMVPYTFSEGQTVKVLNEHFPEILNWLDEVLYPHGERITLDTDFIDQANTFAKSIQ